MHAHAHRYQYANIFKLVKDLGISDPFTPWTSSSFYNPSGLQVNTLSVRISGITKIRGAAGSVSTPLLRRALW